MITTMKLVSEAEKALGNVSDYRLAKVLDIRATTISNWRNRGTVMDDETAKKAAKIAGLNEEWVLACLAAERAKGKASYPTWKRIAEHVHQCILCKIDGLICFSF